MDHSKIITAAAREILRPAGLVQKGRSRTWLDDHGWWLVLVEFQPSGFDRGSYLNVGVMWLLYPQDHFTFHDGYREHDFIAARDDAQFRVKADGLCRLALERVEGYRALLTGPVAAYERQEELLRDEEQRIGFDGLWNLYLTGAFALLSGRRDRGLGLLSDLDAYPAKADFEAAVVRAVSALRQSADPVQLLAEQVRSTRAALKLPEVQVSFETPSR